MRRNKMQHLIKLAQDGAIVNAAITDSEAEYLRKEGFKVEKDKYSVFNFYRINKIKGGSNE